MDPVVLAILSLVGVVIGPIITWKIAKRNTSGSIDTSEAATLWAESNEMRKELRDEVVTLRTELKAVRDYAANLEKDNIQSHKKINELILKIKAAEAKVRKLIRKNKILEDKYVKLGGKL